MRGRVRQPRHERQELGEATRPAIGQDQRDPAAAAGPFVHWEVHPDAIDLGPEVTEPVQPEFLRAPVEAVRPVFQKAAQVTEICALLPRRAWRRPWPPGVPDPRTHVGQDLVTHADAELLRPEGSHPASLAPRQHHQAPGRGSRTPADYPGTATSRARPATSDPVRGKSTVTRRVSSRAGAPSSPRALPSFQAGCSRQRESSSVQGDGRGCPCSCARWVPRGTSGLAPPGS